ncbi:BtpA/SgcQ family protein [Shimazuella kribbensis]|uniref:BtpA/SgcQ family protein n=1 Tax=Shimazuella kribbensis TaxID=139808 RepID=UPI00040373E0|nr:BtpA/SgcQ family protein [Shimazuella kribbensis]
MKRNKKGFLDLFHVKKPIMAMIHLKGTNDEQKVEIAKKEIDQLIHHGIDAVIIENYFGNVENVEEVLKYIHHERKEIIYGVNVLDDDRKSFELANKYGAHFIQIDSIAGHLTVEEDKGFDEFISQMRRQSQVYVLGGVRFKYQPYLSGRSLETDLRLATQRCDGIVVTGSGTGIETDFGKIQKFRAIIGDDFPLIVGAGVTAENAAVQLSQTDAAIVGSYLKDTYKDDGDVSVEHVQHFMKEVGKWR